MNQAKNQALLILGPPTAVVAGFLLIGSVLSFLGEWWWLFDIIANFRIQLVAAGLVLVFAAAALRTGGVVAMGVLIVAVNLLPIIPFYFGGDESGKPPDLVVASYNLLHSATAEKDGVVAWLDELEADVVFLQEAGAEWSRILVQADLNWRLVHAPVERGQGFGILALVPQEAEVDFVDVIGRPAPMVVLDVEGVAVTLLGIHAVSPFNEERAMQRDVELLAVADWVVEQSGNVVVVGDFNATPWSWAFERLVEVTGLENSLDGFGVQRTWPAGNVLLRIPIDHLLHSDGLTVVDRRVLPGYGSDHLPLVVELAVSD